MMGIFYDVLIALYALCSLPAFMKKKRGGERYALTLRELFARGAPILKQSVWIHAVSVGEVKGAAILYETLAANYPKHTFVVTTATKTGLEKARELFPATAHFFILPLDFSWVMRRFVARLAPELVVVSESDFWRNMLKEARRMNARCLLINGKLSERSYRRFSHVRFFSKPLLRSFTHLFVQNASYKRRFISLGVDPDDVTIAGNSKFLVPPSKEALPLGECAVDQWITFGSTHKEEEDALLDTVAALLAKHPRLGILFVPRHPERFTPVFEKMKRIPIEAARLSETTAARCILVDAMGVLTQCYRRSVIGVVAGSFDPALEGHDIFEVINNGSVPLFGPYMSMQSDMVFEILQSNAGIQTTQEELFDTLDTLIREGVAVYKKNAESVRYTLRASSEHMLEKIANSH